MQKPEVDLASFGAEALPGGLTEINQAMRGQPPATAGNPRSGKAPLVGLIALAALWGRKENDRG